MKQTLPPWGYPPRAQAFWDELCAAIEQTRDVAFVYEDLPAAQSGQYEDAFFFVWDIREHHLDIELKDDGLVEWFYLDLAKEPLPNSDLGGDEYVTAIMQHTP